MQLIGHLSLESVGSCDGGWQCSPAFAPESPTQTEHPFPNPSHEGYQIWVLQFRAPTVSALAPRSHLATAPLLSTGLMRLPANRPRPSSGSRSPCASCWRTHCATLTSPQTW